MKISIEESDKKDVEEKIQNFKKHMNFVFIEFVRLVNLKKFGIALEMATKFTEEIDEFHDDILSTDSTETIFSVLNNFKVPLHNWRDFLEDHFYFDDAELMTRWIDVEKKYFRKKWDFTFDQRAYYSELESCRAKIITHAYHNNYLSADNVWIKVKEILPELMSDNVKEKWRRYENEYLLWKKNFEEGNETFIVKITEELKQKVKSLTKDSLDLMNQGKLVESFKKQSKIVKILENHISNPFES